MASISLALLGRPSAQRSGSNSPPCSTACVVAATAAPPLTRSDQNKPMSFLDYGLAGNTRHHLSIAAYDRGSRAKGAVVVDFDAPDKHGLHKPSSGDENILVEPEVAAAPGHVGMVDVENHNVGPPPRPAGSDPAPRRLAPPGRRDHLALLPRPPTG